MQTITCSKCARALSTRQFQKNGTYRRHVCRTCMNTYQRERYQVKKLEAEDWSEWFDHIVQTQQRGLEAEAHRQKEQYQPGQFVYLPDGLPWDNSDKTAVYIFIAYTLGLIVTCIAIGIVIGERL